MNLGLVVLPFVMLSAICLGGETPSRPGPLTAPSEDLAVEELRYEETGNAQERTRVFGDPKTGRVWEYREIAGQLKWVSSHRFKPWKPSGVLRPMGKLKENRGRR